MKYTLYFAYGSNMNEAQFQERCPSSHFLCRAVLNNFRLIITSRGYANVVRQERCCVHGILCALTESDEKELDRREGFYNGVYRREWLSVKTEFGYSIPALIYIDNTEDEGSPKPGYLEKILDGAARHDLPQEVVAAIEEWKIR